MSEITKLAAALVKAQAEMTGAKKDSDNPFFRSRYADLRSVDAAIGPALEKHGLAYVQRSHNLEDCAAIETVIIHESGESLSCGIVAVPVSKDDAQGYGSAMTYARRYSLSAAFGVCPEDDDGNAAAAAKPKPKVLPTKTGWEPNAEGDDGNAAAKPNTPTQLKVDAFAGLPREAQNAVADMAQAVKDELDAGNVERAYDIRLTYDLSDDQIQAAFFSQFNPKQTRLLKEEGTKRRTERKAA